MIQTTRCQLTPLQNTDLDLVVKLYTNTDVRRFLGGIVNQEEIRLRFLKMVASDAETKYWVVRLKDNSTSVGIVSLGTHHNNIDTEISYQLLPEWWGKGYATEVVEAVVTYGLEDLGLERVIAETQIANIASCRLLEKIGMGLEQTLERFGAKQGIFTTKPKKKQL